MPSRTSIYLLWLLACAILVQSFATAMPLARMPLHAMSSIPMEHMDRQTCCADHDATSNEHSVCPHHACCTGAALLLHWNALIDLPVSIHIAVIAHDFISHIPAYPERPPCALAPQYY